VVKAQVTRMISIAGLTFAGGVPADPANLDLVRAYALAVANDAHDRGWPDERFLKMARRQRNCSGGPRVVLLAVDVDRSHRLGAG
jgi:hypothetical protein